VDEVMRDLQGASAEVEAVRFCPLSMRVGVVDLPENRWQRIETREEGELTVAKVIEFYVPVTFRKRAMKWIPLDQRGKIIEFIAQTKKSA